MVTTKSKFLDLAPLSLDSTIYPPSQSHFSMQASFSEIIKITSYQASSFLPYLIPFPPTPIARLILHSYSCSETFLAPITNRKKKNPPFLKLIERGKYQDLTAFTEEVSKNR